jgi:hypothetical protein
MYEIFLISIDSQLHHIVKRCAISDADICTVTVEGVISVLSLVKQDQYTTEYLKVQELLKKKKEYSLTEIPLMRI